MSTLSDLDETVRELRKPYDAETSHRLLVEAHEETLRALHDLSASVEALETRATAACSSCLIAGGGVCSYHQTRKAGPAPSDLPTVEEVMRAVQGYGFACSVEDPNGSSIRVLKSLVSRLHTAATEAEALSAERLVWLRKVEAERDALRAKYAALAANANVNRWMARALNAEREAQQLEEVQRLELRNAADKLAAALDEVASLRERISFCSGSCGPLDPASVGVIPPPAEQRGECPRCKGPLAGDRCATAAPPAEGDEPAPPPAAVPSEQEPADCKHEQRKPTPFGGEACASCNEILRMDEPGAPAVPGRPTARERASELMERFVSEYLYENKHSAESAIAAALDAHAASAVAAERERLLSRVQWAANGMCGQLGCEGHDPGDTALYHANCDACRHILARACIRAALGEKP